MEEKLLSVSQTAEKLGVKNGSIYKFIREGQLQCFRFGRCIRISRGDLSTFASRCRG